MDEAKEVISTYPAWATFTENYGKYWKIMENHIFLICLMGKSTSSTGPWLQ
jgi:hypothetical protein